MEHARPRQQSVIRANPEIELQELLEAMIGGICGKLPARVAVAKGKGFVHFEVRCSREARELLVRLRTPISTLMKVAGTVRKTRVSLDYHEQNAVETRPPETENATTLLEHLVSTMASSLADRPEEVVVFAADGDGFSHYQITCDNRDVGSLLGTRAAHADAMRAILGAAGHARGMRATLQIGARD